MKQVTFEVSAETLARFEQVKEKAYYTAKVIATTSKAVVLNSKDDVPVVVTVAPEVLPNLKVGMILEFNEKGVMTTTSSPKGVTKPMSTRQTPNHAPIDC